MALSAARDTYTKELHFTLTVDPDNIEALCQLGIISYLEFDDFTALILLTKALEVNNFLVPALIILGEITQSLKYYERAVKIDKHPLVLKFLVKACLRSKGIGYEIGKHCDRVKDLTNDHILLLEKDFKVNLAKLFRFSDRLEEASVLCISSLEDAETKNELINIAIFTRE